MLLSIRTSTLSTRYLYLRTGESVYNFGCTDTIIRCILVGVQSTEHGGTRDTRKYIGEVSYGRNTKMGSDGSLSSAVTRDRKWAKPINGGVTASDG